MDDDLETFDHFGVLKLWDQYLQFIPLDATKSGAFDYVFDKNLQQNSIIEFNINYDDLNLDEPMIMPLPNSEVQEEEDGFEDYSVNFNIQLNLFKTGYYALAPKDHQILIDSYRQKRVCIAQVTLKIPNSSLSEKRRKNDDKESFANMLQQSIVTKSGRYLEMLQRKQIPPKSEWLTTVSTFDIMYEQILPELELQEGSKLKICEANNKTFEEIFGYKNLLKITDIHNQCLYPLEFTFPELEKPIDFQNLLSRNGGFLNTFVLADHSYQTLNMPSRILSIIAAEKLREYLPSYLKYCIWKRLFATYEDGISMKQ